MTKVTKIISSLVAVSALWLGGTAYVSSNTKSYLDAYVEKTNNLYKANGMEMSVENFEEGFFSSSAKVNIDFVEPELRKIINETLKLPMEINYTIENGPLFFQNGLGFGASRIRNRLNLGEYFVDKEAFEKVFKDEVILTSKTDINFFKRAVFDAQTNKIVAIIEGDEIHISPLEIEGDMNIKTFEGSMKMMIASIASQNKTELINIKKLLLDADITKFYDNGFYLGNFVLKADSVNMKDEVLPFELKEAKIDIAMNIDKNKDETIDMKLKIGTNVRQSKLPEAYAFLEKFSFSYALNGVKLEGLLAFQDFTKRLQKREQEVASKLTTATGELDMDALEELQKIQKESQDDMMVMMAGLLKKERTSFEVEMIMTDKEEKNSNLKLNIAYVGDDDLPTTAKELEEKFRKELLSLISIDLGIQLEKAYIDNLPLEFQQELSSQLQMGKMFGIVNENNNSYSFDAQYKAKTLMVNGTNRTEMLQMLEASLVN